MSVQTSERNRPFRWRPDQQWEAYLFLLPSLAGFSVFVVLAVVASLGISFSDWGLTGFKDFAGWSNYRALFRDPVFWKSLRNTGFYLVTIVPMQLSFGLLLALALNQAVRGQLIYRLIYFMPVVTTIVAGAIVFRLILSTNGPLNGGIMGVADLLGLSLDPPNWLGSSRYTKWSVVMLTLWKNTGFTMVIYLAALQGVPQELYDAAMADGASSLAAAAPCHPAPDQPHHLFSLCLPGHRRLPTLHRAFCDDPGRPGQRFIERGTVYLFRRLPGHPHGQGVGHGLGALPLHLRLHLGPEPYAAALGLLRDRIA